MKKRSIIIGILVVLIIAVIVAIVVYNNTQSNNEVSNNETTFEEVQTIEEGNIFLAKIITNEKNRIIVIPNSDEVIYQLFKVLNVLVSDNTSITNKDASITSKENLVAGQTVKIEFDGKIISTNPTNIIAKSIEIQ